MKDERAGNPPRIPAIGEVGWSVPQRTGRDAYYAGLRRYFSSTMFSVLAGIVAPVICLSLQPILITSIQFSLPGINFINNYWLFGYGTIGLEMIVLALWLVFGARLGVWSGLVSGVLYAGAFFAGGLALILLPFSLLGLFILIGALGFVPFLTAYVFTTNAARAYRQARSFVGGSRSRRSVVFGAILALTVPVAIQALPSIAVRSAIRDVAAGNPKAMARLQFWLPLADRDSLLWKYDAERDPVRKARLGTAYKKLTGMDPDARISLIND